MILMRAASCLFIKNHMKGPRKRTEDDDVRFAQSFEKLILMEKSKEGAQSGTI